MLNRLLSMVGEYSRFETFVYDQFTGSVLHDWSAQVLFDDIADSVPSSGTVLDVGCGGGHFALRLKEAHPELTISGVDITDEMVNLARERAEERGIDVTFDQGDALDLPYESNRFDHLSSIGSIKHWPDQAIGMKECLRVLKPGGKFKILELETGRSTMEYYRFLHDLDHPPVIREMMFPFFLSVVNSQGIDEATYKTLRETFKDQVENASIYQAEKTDAYRVPLLVFEGTHTP